MIALDDFLLLSFHVALQVFVSQNTHCFAGCSADSLVWYLATIDLVAKIVHFYIVNETATIIWHAPADAVAAIAPTFRRSSFDSRPPNVR